MNENMAVLDPSDVFEDMVLSSVFEPQSASIEEKRQIFGKAWTKSVSWLQSSFDSAGINPRTESYGFGFLVEAFARFSGRLPRSNTEKGAEAARTIISELHSGKKGNVNLTHSRSNSDFLWVELTGRRVTITGIGEIKSSYKAASQEIGGQLKRQESSLELLAKELESSKVRKSVKGFFQKRNISISDNLEKFLIVPHGEGEKAGHDKRFSGWQIIQLEFSYGELVFVAKKIWPNFRPDVRIGPGRLTFLFQVASNLGDWIKPKLDSVFIDSVEFNEHNPLPYFELGLFFLATGKTPMLEDEVRWSAELVRKSFWPAVQGCLNLFTDPAPRLDIFFSERERVVFSKFLYLLTSNREDLKYFIYFIRNLDVQIKDLARDQHQVRQLENMSEVWTV